MIHQVRVIFGDTDQLGVVYYANYLRYFEAARAAYLRSLGSGQKDLEAWGLALPVVEAHCRYVRPAHYEDLLDVDLRVDSVRGASLRFCYEIRRESSVLVHGYTVHACMNSAGKPCRMPKELKALIAAGATTINADTAST